MDFNNYSTSRSPFDTMSTFGHNTNNDGMSGHIIHSQQTPRNTAFEMGHQDRSFQALYTPTSAASLYQSTSPVMPNLNYTMSSSFGNTTSPNQTPMMNITSNTPSHVPFFEASTAPSLNGFNPLADNAMNMSRSTSTQSALSNSMGNMFPVTTSLCNSGIMSNMGAISAMNSLNNMNNTSAMNSVNSLRSHNVHDVNAMTSANSAAMFDNVQNYSCDSSLDGDYPDRNEDKTYSCTYTGCPIRFDTMEELQSHKKEVHRNGNQRPGVDQKGPFVCRRYNPTLRRHCATQFNRPYDLTRHERSAHGPPQEKLHCNVCPDRTFSRVDALTRHYTHVHHKDPPEEIRRHGRGRRSSRHLDDASQNRPNQYVEQMPLPGPPASLNLRPIKTEQQYVANHHSHPY